MPETHDNFRCPQCHALMQTGFLPVSNGMTFIRGDGRSASHFAEGIPGTHAIMRTNKLIAWRCKGCEMVLFRYGRDSAKKVERLLEEDEITDQELAEQLEAEGEDDAQSPRRTR